MKLWIIKMLYCLTSVFVKKKTHLQHVLFLFFMKTLTSREETLTRVKDYSYIRIRSNWAG